MGNSIHAKIIPDNFHMPADHNMLIDYKNFTKNRSDWCYYNYRIVLRLPPDIRYYNREVSQVISSNLSPYARKTNLNFVDFEEYIMRFSSTEDYLIDQLSEWNKQYNVYLHPLSYWDSAENPPILFKESISDKFGYRYIYGVTLQNSLVKKRDFCIDSIVN